VHEISVKSCLEGTFMCAPSQFSPSPYHLPMCAVGVLIIADLARGVDRTDISKTFLNPDFLLDQQLSNTHTNWQTIFWQKKQNNSQQNCTTLALGHYTTQSPVVF